MKLFLSSKEWQLAYSRILAGKDGKSDFPKLLKSDKARYGIYRYSWDLSCIRKGKKNMQKLLGL